MEQNPAPFFRENRRYALVGSAGLAAVLTPPDPISHILGTALLFAVFEITIWWFDRQAKD
jgi:Sec-independent protein secretion pathway component TatC